MTTSSTPRMVRGLSGLGVLWALAAAGLGCSSNAEACGAGEALIGGVCTPYSAGSNPDGGTGTVDEVTDGARGTRDASAAPASPDGGNGGGRDSGTPGPGVSDGGTGQSGRGCSLPGGECARWVAELKAGVEQHQRSHGCALTLTENAKLTTLAETHAGFQANQNRVTIDAPEGGSILDQISRLGLTVWSAGALVSASTSGPDDIVKRWESGAQTARVLNGCDDTIGVGVATAANGTSYVTVLLVRSMQ